MMRSLRFFVLASALAVSSCGGNGDKSADPAPQARDQPSSANATFAVPIDGLPAMGASDALVTIVEFTDYDCPFCAKSEHTMRALREKYGRDLRVAVAAHPLPMHAHARDAALVALGVDGASFETIHTRLFDNPDSRTADDYAKLTKDLPRNRSSANDALANAEALGATLHVHGTPTFFVNGRKIGGAQPLATFAAVVDEELARARALVASGVSRSRVYDAIVSAARANPAPVDDEPAEKITVVPAARDVGGAQFLGRANASKTITLFTDFECPYCKKLDARLREIAQAHADVRVVLRNKPLPMHAHARLAAKAAIAASAQDKLDAYAAALFEHQDALDRASLISHATRAGLDVARFTRDLDSAETEARLAEDEALAAKLGVTGTPTSFVQEREVVGAQPIATFEDAIQWTSRP